MLLSSRETETVMRGVCFLPPYHIGVLRGADPITAGHILDVDREIGDIVTG